MPKRQVTSQSAEELKVSVAYIPTYKHTHTSVHPAHLYKLLVFSISEFSIFCVAVKIRRQNTTSYTDIIINITFSRKQKDAFRW